LTARVLPPPLVGFNNNFRYRGMNFHIQTEDSGVGRPHIITHLFADGGRVIKTLRVDYSEHVNGPDYRTVVQRMMREQHRAMAYDLRKGSVDVIIDELLPRQTPPGTDAATRSVPAPAGAGENSERHEPAPALSAAAKPASLTEAAPRAAAADGEKALASLGSHARGAAEPLAARAWPEQTAAFAALPPDSLDDLILRYVARAPSADRRSPAP
jgi:hypothetical protein